MAIKHFCDICGKEMIYFDIRELTCEYNEDDYIGEKSIEVCPKCYRKIMDYIVTLKKENNA